MYGRMLVVGVHAAQLQALPMLMPTFDREIARLAERLLIKTRPIDYRLGVFASEVIPGIPGEKPVTIKMIDADTKEHVETIEVRTEPSCFVVMVEAVEIVTVYSVFAAGSAVDIAGAIRVYREGGMSYHDEAPHVSRRRRPPPWQKSDQGSPCQYNDCFYDFWCPLVCIRWTLAWSRREGCPTPRPSASRTWASRPTGASFR